MLAIFKKEIEKTLKDKPKVILAISGGVDSMTLLDLFIKNYQTDKLVICHLNHKIRKDSKKDHKLIKKICKEHKLKYFYKSKSAERFARKHKLNLESAGRKLRYDFFNKVLIKTKAKYIVTAHHQDDLVETILMNLIRGCSLNGLIGLKQFNENKYRPLLQFTKKQITEYSKENNIQFNEDSTNKDTTYLRNYIRKHLLPKTDNKKIVFLSNYVQKFQEKIKKLTTTNIKDFLNYSEFIQKEILLNLYEKTYGHRRNIYKKNLTEILKVIYNKENYKKTEFGKDFWITKSKTEILIKPQNPS